jgi:hypothetical protein
MSLDLNDLDGGSNSWLPEEIGDKIKGKILDVKRVQQTDFTTGEPLFWQDEQPRLQTVVELQTDLSESGDDDGKRTVWLKGGANYEAAEGKGKSGEVALSIAAKADGATAVEEGADLIVIFSGLAKATVRGYNQAKLYSMKYTAPKASISADDLDFDD